MQGIAIDLAKNHFCHVRRQITVYGTWVRQGDSWRPCLALIRTGEEQHEATIPCILTLEKAFVFSDVAGDPAQAALIAIDFARCLRMDFTNRREVLKIMMLINDYLTDLISMPPRPHHDPVVMVEGTMTNRETGKSRDLIITESS